MSRRKSPRSSVTVKIAGEKHVLRSDAPPEYTRAVAAHVDETIKELGGQTIEAHRTAILAALSITDELFRVREELRLLTEQVEQQAGALADLLDATAEKHPPDPAG